MPGKEGVISILIYLETLKALKGLATLLLTIPFAVADPRSALGGRGRLRPGQGQPALAGPPCMPEAPHAAGGAGLEQEWTGPCLGLTGTL